MTELPTMQSVYCYLFPEVWKRKKEVDKAIPREYHLTTTPVEELIQISELFSPPLRLPEKNGFFNEDEVHVPILERIVDRYKPLVPALQDFPFVYPTPGSSEGIFKLLTKLKVEGVEEINVLDGEYEGFGAYAGPENLGMNVNTFYLETLNPRKINPGTWFVSNPSARNGNIIPNEIIRELCDSGHKVIVDLAYVGSTEAYDFDIDHENIPAVVFSLSKPYGAFRFRIGATFSRDSIHSLYGNKWFKDSERLLLGLKLVEELGPDEQGNTKLFKTYKPVQEKIIEEVNNETGLGIMASDAFLIGYLHENDTTQLSERQSQIIKPYQRGSNYRFCFTPAFEQR